MQQGNRCRHACASCLSPSLKPRSVADGGRAGGAIHCVKVAAVRPHRATIDGRSSAPLPPPPKPAPRRSGGRSVGGSVAAVSSHSPLPGSQIDASRRRRRRRSTSACCLSHARTHGHTQPTDLPAGRAGVDASMPPTTARPARTCIRGMLAHSPRAHAHPPNASRRRRARLKSMRLPGWMLGASARHVLYACSGTSASDISCACEEDEEEDGGRDDCDWKSHCCCLRRNDVMT